MRLLPLVLLITACSRELAPPPSYILSSVGRDPLGVKAEAAAFAEATASHTTPWADSTRRGDTVFHSRGRVVTTLAIHTDSTWAVLPQVAFGLPSGPTNLPPDSLCTLGYTGTNLPVVAGRVLRQLDRVRECQAKAFAVIRRAKLKDAVGQLSVEAARTELAGWPWDGVCSRVKDSTIIGFFIGDDVTANEWGPAPLATRLAQWDSIGGIIDSYCPGAPVVLRALPTQMEARPSWRWVTTAWAQYAGVQRHGSPEQFFAAQVASARRQRLGLVAGLNLLNGGCGPVGQSVSRCLPGIPGTALAGTRDGLFQLSAEEMVYYKTVAMTEPYVCASIDWSWSPNFESGFHERPEIQSAARALAVIARKRPQTSCIQR